jgi:hypothetical protein
MGVWSNVNFKQKAGMVITFIVFMIILFGSLIPFWPLIIVFIFLPNLLSRIYFNVCKQLFGTPSYSEIRKENKEIDRQQKQEGVKIMPLKRSWYPIIMFSLVFFSIIVLVLMAYNEGFIPWPLW